MNPFRQRAEEITDKAKDLHDCERRMTLESVELIGEMDRHNASGYLMLDTEGLAKRIGLSKNQFWKRRQAARVLRRFPAFRELLVSGETSVTALAILAPKVTAANVRGLLAGIKGKTTREVKDLVTRTGFDGFVVPPLPTAQVPTLLERAGKVAASRGRLITKKDLIREALELWLEEWDENSPPSNDISSSSSSSPSSSEKGLEMKPRIEPLASLQELPLEWWIPLMPKSTEWTVQGPA